ncbi:MAG: cytochrome c3 family protein [Vicinamibacterales bacterium]
MPAWLVAVAVLVSASACTEWTARTELAQSARVAQRSRWGTSSVYTPARTGARDALAAHFGLRAAPVQPFAYSHRIHLQNELTCTDCHEGVDRGPRAGIPGITTCMGCHSAIATDAPLVRTLAEMQEQGRDLAWQRVYDYPREAHVRFAHAPHVRAGVDCATCHGDMRQQDVARRMVDMDMAFCVNCHTQKQASNDCLTCHY